MTDEQCIAELIKNYNLKGNLANMLKFMADLSALMDEQKKQSYARGFEAGLNVQLKTEI